MQIKMAISTGDFDSKDHELDDADVVILTNENHGCDDDISKILDL